MKTPAIGKHLARAACATLSTMGKENKPCVYVEFVLSDDPTIGDGWIGWLGDSVGQDKKTLTERTVGVLRSCGWEGDDLSDIQLPKDNEVEIVVDDDEYKGKVTRKIQFVNPIGGGFRPKAMAAGDAKKFAEKLKPKVGGKPTAKPAPVSEGEPDVEEDEIPF